MMYQLNADDSPYYIYELVVVRLSKLWGLKASVSQVRDLDILPSQFPIAQSTIY